MSKYDWITLGLFLLKKKKKKKGNWLSQFFQVYPCINKVILGRLQCSAEHDAIFYG